MFRFREIREVRGNLNTRRNTGYDIPKFDIDPDVRVGDANIPKFADESDISRFTEEVDPDERIPVK